MSSRTIGIGFLGQRLRHNLMRLFAPERLLRAQYRHFRTLLKQDGHALELLVELDTFLSGENPADICRVRYFCNRLIEAAAAMAHHLRAMNPSAYSSLEKSLQQLRRAIEHQLPEAAPEFEPLYILSLEQAADHPGIAGGKAANLSAAGRKGVRIPAGFVITANALHRVFAVNGLDQMFSDRFQQATSGDQKTLVRIAGELQEFILQATIPAEIEKMIVDSACRLSSADRFAVRSSALAEDGTISFAGQYTSELDVQPDDLIVAYKRVIAGKYCQRAISYRINHGLSDADTAMAVLVVEMLSPRISGVVYTRDPAPSAEGVSLGVYAVPGIAAGLVDGSKTPEKYHLSRHSHHIYSCEQQLYRTPLLRQAELLQLKNQALELERRFGCPQDIEWAMDETGITILQSRRLQQQQDPPSAEVVPADLGRLLSRDLLCAAPGSSCGPIFFAPLGKTFRTIPQGSVVVTPTLRPSLSQFLDRIAGVIAENGSRASHFACVARERGVPVLVGK
ncbi:MAG: PEP/pyruvate-binding domain-containing protein, partial [Desulforhopalus sp.]